MSEAALTDSTTAHSSPALTWRPASGRSRKTMSPSASWAWSVMPTVTVPSASSFTHSWDLVYFRSAGTFISFLLDEDFAIAHEGRLDHLRPQQLVANLDLHFVAGLDAGRYAGQCDRLVHARREAAAGGLAGALGGDDLLVRAQHAAVD